MNRAQLDQLVSMALHIASDHYDDLSPLLHQLALDVALITGELNGSRCFLREVERRKTEAGSYKPRE